MRVIVAYPILFCNPRIGPEKQDDGREESPSANDPLAQKIVTSRLMTLFAVLSISA
jgi:hypothetical protein